MASICNLRVTFLEKVEGITEQVERKFHDYELISVRVILA